MIYIFLQMSYFGACPRFQETIFSGICKEFSDLSTI